MQDVIDRLLTATVLFVPRVLASIAIFAAFWVASIVFQAIVVKVGTTRRFHAEMVTVIRQVVKGAVLALGTVTALGTTGFNVSALVAGLGLTGFALGFALKDVLSNVAAGVLILGYRPFRHADRVSIAGFDGLVAEIDLRYTTLQAGDRRILVPNSTIMTSPISVFGQDVGAENRVSAPEGRRRGSPATPPP
jgi:small conductance mechanosensitive channel